MAVCSSRIPSAKLKALHYDLLRPAARNPNSLVTFNNLKCLTKNGHLYCNHQQPRLIICSSLNSGVEPPISGAVVGNVLQEGNKVEDVDRDYVERIDDGSNGGGDVLDGCNGNGNGKFVGGGGGGGGDGNGDDSKGGDEEDNEFGPIMKFEEVIKEVESRGTSLPADMLEAAKSTGLRKLLLERYLDLQGSSWPVSFVMKSCSMIRDRMLADPAFLFKVGTEIIIDSCCATIAEVQKRGKDFWAEFELYLADLLVGLVVNVALVGMLAPYARIGQPSVSKGLGFLGRMQYAYGALPSSVFEAERPGCRFSSKQRMATYFFKGIMYGVVGFACGIIGQGIANMIMTAKRSLKKSEEDVPVPPLIKSAALWGVFLAVSSNTRYQIINGLERIVESSPMARKIPPVAMAFTVGVRFANNIYGGMQFVDWAKMSGVQ
ncbi:protein RETICULATA, chloroplastic-like [Impatiens glandulifera]|uniref:protein RETICULATA, chloroplastic-like n=1 Tax=Impatiens glandulifera TaxID=253017 RepID=UPI001FB156AD|nr:protein RETICULATA, chloroplastic-like [Impatiens glandulifera]